MYKTLLIYGDVYIVQLRRILDQGLSIQIAMFSQFAALNWVAQYFWSL